MPMSARCESPNITIGPSVRTELRTTAAYCGDGLPSTIGSMSSYSARRAATSMPPPGSSRPSAG